MKTPLTTGNPIPSGCGCWVVRGDDFAYREICGRFSPNPFATIIAPAEVTDRRCYAIEQEPGYVDQAVARWERFTGKRAVLMTPELDAAGVIPHRHLTRGSHAA